MKRAQISLVTFDLLAAKAQDEAIGAVIAYEKTCYGSGWLKLNKRHGFTL